MLARRTGMRLPFLFLAACATATSAEPRSDEGPVVIELFTSQGCSSCPPADAYINQLAKAGQLGGRALAPLTFHVDYWNDLGWADPFSTPAWTDRQQAYARSLGDAQVYTPELVVAGGAGMVGSQVSKVERAIAAAPKQTRVVASAAWQPKQVTVTATAPDGADVWVAIWQDGTRTKVLRGENQGETLPSERVVRELRRVAAPGKDGSVTIALDGSWIAGGAVAFAQRGDRKIVGATLLGRR
jgi:hypothetical protein